MVEQDLQASRLEEEGRLQRKRIAHVVAALLALAVAFMAGMIVGVKLERGRKQIAMAPKEAVEKPPEAKKEKKEVPITFYERLTETEGEEVVAPEREEAKGPVAEERGSKTPLKPPQEVKKGEPGGASEEVLATKTRGSYFIQVASFRKRSNAEALLRKLEGRGLQAEMVPVVIKGVQWFRVLIRGLDEEGAQRVKEALEREGFKGLKVKREG